MNQVKGKGRKPLPSIAADCSGAAIYSSDDPEFEARMIAIRDDPQNRVLRMAQQRAKAGRQMIPFDGIELLWIIEEDRFSNTIPLLQPQEYWAMIRGLAADLRRAKTTDT